MNQIAKKEALVSIIVPVYNVEKYLDECIQSIVQQTYPNLEIILVDDGSTDDSGKKCDEWAKLDNRIKVIHQKNQGSAAARNFGLDIATGEYIQFVDSDDYILNTMTEDLLSVLVKSEADMSMCGLVTFAGDDEIIQKSEHCVKKQTAMTGKEICYSALENEWGFFDMTTSVVWNKLYSRELFSSVRFPVGHCMEDSAILHRIYGQAQKVALLHSAPYYYRQRQGSVMSSAGKETKRLMDRLWAFLDRAYYYEEMGFNDLAAIFHEKVFWGLINNYSQFKKEKDTKQDLHALMKMGKDLFAFYKKHAISKKVRVEVSLFLFSPCLHGIIFGFCRKIKKGEE